MAEVSRTARVIQNAKVALFFYCINLILQFFSRKIFLDYLGAELLGLNTTAQNLLQFLNLAESGIGTAVAFALYKPLSQKNRQEIIDIVSLQGWFYRWVGLFVIAGSIVLMAFFPWIFAKADVPLVYVYGTFIAFLISALLGYFVNYKMIVLSADQKEYKITIETQSIKVIKIFIQMLAIWKLPHGYLWWMCLEVIASVAVSIRLNLVIQKEYPWLQTKISQGGKLQKKYSYLLIKTKQLFFHKIGSYVLTQTTPLIVYAFASLTLVAIYGNYLIIMTGCLLLANAFFRGINSSVGNLVAGGDNLKIKQIFWEVFTLRLYFASVICTGIFYLSDSFITLWIGYEYLLPRESLFILICIYFIQMSRSCEIFLSAYGLFKDIWAPIVEAVLNIGLSIALGYFWGIFGIFMGILVSLIVVINGWKPYFLFKEGFKQCVLEYVRTYTVKLILIFISSVLTYLFLSSNPLTKVYNFFDWVYNAAIVVIASLFFSTLIFYLFDSAFRSLVSHLIYTLKK
ncbi:lipopolysaccharide biosynthesis protein [Parasutterella secunda]|uniref:lipopolysaccharide biosynthesis protein n=1 Tax=Parasutterella secunda TaxID=626947 RepID=UPI0025A375A7|nr:hypothetical protein [Parasutterella secunda]MDM8226298.1 hypothetical protein [Parasutterella secunda]